MCTVALLPGQYVDEKKLRIKREKKFSCLNVEADETKTRMKKAQRRRKHCALAVVTWSQNFHHAADPLPKDVGRPKFNQLEMVTTFTYRPSLVKIDAHNFELSW